MILAGFEGGAFIGRGPERPYHLIATISGLRLLRLIFRAGTQCLAADHFGWFGGTLPVVARANAPGPWRGPGSSYEVDACSCLPPMRGRGGSFMRRRLRCRGPWCSMGSHVTLLPAARARLCRASLHSDWHGVQFVEMPDILPWRLRNAGLSPSTLVARLVFHDAAA